jgi:hypothetical protein
MRILVLAFVAGLAALMFLVCVPGSVTWIQALRREDQFSAAGYFTEGPALVYIGTMICAAALLFVMLRRMLALNPVRPERAGAFAGDEGGALIFEFALVFPFILSLIFILFQWAELLMCDSITHYAAFVAARTASTFSPENLGAGRFKINDGDEKKKKMEEAAAFAMAPAMALEGLSSKNRMTPKVELMDLRGNAVTSSSTEIDKLRKYDHVGVNVSWGLWPRWPVVGFFFKPMLQNGKIPMSRSYRMEVEPYVGSRPAYPFDMAYRTETTRKALHDTIFPVGHARGLPPYFNADTVRDRMLNFNDSFPWPGGCPPNNCQAWRSILPNGICGEPTPPGSTTSQ